MYLIVFVLANNFHKLIKNIKKKLSITYDTNNIILNIDIVVIFKVS